MLQRLGNLGDEAINVMRFNQHARLYIHKWNITGISCLLDLAVVDVAEELRPRRGIDSRLYPRVMAVDHTVAIAIPPHLLKQHKCIR